MQPKQHLGNGDSTFPDFCKLFFVNVVCQFSDVKNKFTLKKHVYVNKGIFTISVRKRQRTNGSSLNVRPSAARASDSPARDGTAPSQHGSVPHAGLLRRRRAREVRRRPRAGSARHGRGRPLPGRFEVGENIGFQKDRIFRYTELKYSDEIRSVGNPCSQFSNGSNFVENTL